MIKKNLLKYTTLALSLSLIVSMAGCGKKNDGNDNNADNNTEISTEETKATLEEVTEPVAESETTNDDGSITSKMSDGTEMTVNTDGSVEVKQTDGSVKKYENKDAYKNEVKNNVEAKNKEIREENKKIVEENKKIEERNTEAAKNNSNNKNNESTKHEHKWETVYKTVNHAEESHTEKNKIGEKEVATGQTKTIVDTPAYDEKKWTSDNENAYAVVIESTGEIFLDYQDLVSGSNANKEAFDHIMKAVNAWRANPVGEEPYKNSARHGYCPGSYNVRQITIHHEAVTHEEQIYKTEDVYEEKKVIDKEAWSEQVPDHKKCSECGAIE